MKILKSLLLLTALFALFSGVKAQTWNTFTTSHGYIKLGPANTSWAHIYTDRSKFLFNKDVYTLGGFSSYGNNNLYLKTNGSIRMTIRKPNGFVGIGTTLPGAKLEVYNGDILLGGPHKKFIFHTQYWSTNSSKLIIAPKNGASYDWAKAMVLHDNGRVDINGKLYVKEVQVQLPPFPDYVFKKDYNRMSLNELGAYINKHKHLPGIPSAEEVAEKGIGVSVLMTKQMEKIEELTLYILELKKEIDQLKAQQQQ